MDNQRPYRAIPIDGTEFVYGCLVEINTVFNTLGKRCWIVARPEISESDDMTEKHCSIWGFIEVIPETVGQATGLKDKNGDKVFAGDEIYVFDKVLCKVMWSHTHMGWAVQYKGNPEGLPMSMSDFPSRDIELIKEADNE